MFEKFWMESFSIYIPIFTKICIFLSHIEKIYGALQILKKAYSELLKIFKKILSKLMLFLKLTARKILNYKEIFFLVYVAKSISFEVLSLLKITCILKLKIRLYK